MKLKGDHKITKGMIFAGCSFTWGQGLYFYSNLETLENPDNKWGYSPGLVSLAHNKFKESNRFSRIVSNFFQKYDLVHYKNGGANDQIINFWKTCFESKTPQYLESFHPGETDLTFPVDYDEISHVIFQLTQPNRDKFSYTVGEEFVNVPMQWNLVVEHKKYQDLFQRYLLENSIDISEFNEEFARKSLNNCLNFLRDCEERGIKTYIITWPENFSKHIDNDQWARERWIKIQHSGFTYGSIEELMKMDGLSICEDYSEFEIPPNDCHPSLSVHRSIAISIINFIINKEGNG